MKTFRNTCQFWLSSSLQTEVFTWFVQLEWLVAALHFFVWIFWSNTWRIKVMSALTWTVQKHSWSFTEKLVEQLCQQITLSMLGNPKILFQLIHNNFVFASWSERWGDLFWSCWLVWSDVCQTFLKLLETETFHYFLSLCCVLKYSTSRSSAQEPRQSLSGGLLSLFDPPLITFLIYYVILYWSLVTWQEGRPVMSWQWKTLRSTSCWFCFE